MVTYGMTRSQYWHGKPEVSKHYRENYKRAMQERENEMWRQGLYFLDALNCAIHNNLNFSGKHTAPRQYIKEPLRLFPLTKDEKKVKAEQQKAKIIENLDLWKKAMEKKYGNRNSKP